MGVKYLTAYVESLCAPVVADLDAIPPFGAADDGRGGSNVVVLDASGGMARFLKGDEAGRSIFDYQELFERVAVDVAALRALGYEPVAFLDAAVPPAKLPLWKARRRAEIGRLLKVARALEGQGAPALPKNCWCPPEGAAQHLADAYAAAGVAVHLGLRDVDLEAAAYARRVRAHALLTCDSDLYLTAAGRTRVWHWERFDADHALWRRRGDATWWPEGGEGEGGGRRQQRQQQQEEEEEVWLPPEGSPGVRGATQRGRPGGRGRRRRWSWPFGGGGRRGGAADDARAPPPAPLPRISVREIRPDLLRERLLLSSRAVPLLAACLGNDAIPHMSRKQLEAVFAEHPDLPPPPPGSAAITAALWADAAAGSAAAAAVTVAGGDDGGSGGGGGGGGGEGAAGQRPPPPPPSGSLLAPDGPGGGAPWRVVEILAHELSRQLAAGLVSVGPGGDDDDDDDAVTAAAAAAASARAAASNPRRPATARFVAHRATVYARAVREAYDPASVAAMPSAAAAVAAVAATAAAAASGPAAAAPPAPTAAPNIIRAVVAHTGALARGLRADDAREPAAVLALRELRMRAYAGAGVWRVRELIYTPLAARPPVLAAAAAAAAAGAAGAAEGPADGSAGAAEGEGDGAAAPASLPAGAARTFGYFWQEEFVDVDVAAELAALGRAKAAIKGGGGEGGGGEGGGGGPLEPLLPTSPEVVAAAQSGEDFADFAARELLRLELITKVEAELLRRQAKPRVRARLRRAARARLLGAAGDRWSGDGGAIACLRSLRVMSLLLTVHTWLAALLDNRGSPSIESALDVRVFNELWRREVGRLEREGQPRGAALRRRWVREGPPPPPSGEEEEEEESEVAGVGCWLPAAGEGGGIGEAGGEGEAAV